VPPIVVLVVASAEVGASRRRARSQVEVMREASYTSERLGSEVREDPSKLLEWAEGGGGGGRRGGGGRGGQKAGNFPAMCWWGPWVPPPPPHF